MSLRALRLIFGTRRGLGLLSVNALVAFGAISGGIQFVGQVFTPKFSQPGELTLGVVFFCLIFGLVRARPRRRIRRDFGRPDMTITVKVGDLFKENCHLVAGFSDTFDTDTTNNVIISRTSVQGQIVDQLYGGDSGHLDSELTSALSGVAVARTERRSDKRAGKLKRYPIGTVAILGPPERRVFAVAYSRMGNDLVAKSSVEDLWHGLSRVWDAIYRVGQRRCVAIPLVGSELARINCLDRESLLKMVLLSFVARSREELICQELIVVLHPKDIDKINMLEVAAFLKTL
jgi:hypothetical protein